MGPLYSAPAQHFAQLGRHGLKTIRFMQERGRPSAGESPHHLRIRIAAGQDHLDVRLKEP